MLKINRLMFAFEILFISFKYLEKILALKFLMHLKFLVLILYNEGKKWMYLQEHEGKNI